MRRRRGRFVLSLVVLAVVALAVRLPFLTARSLWFDEAFSWRLIHFPFPEFLTRAAADVHPLLFYLVLRGWMGLLTPSTPEATLFALRLLSVVFGVLTVVGMAAAGRVLFRSPLIGATAGLLTALNAFQVQYAWEARMYTLGTALLPLAIIGLYRAATAPTARAARRGGVLFGLSLGTLLHVHYYALFSGFALGAAKLLFFLGKMSHGFRHVLRSPNFWAAEGGFFASAALFLPWVVVFLDQVQRVEASFWIPRLNALSVPTTVARLFWGGVGPIGVPWASAAAAVGLALAGLALFRGRTFGDVIAVAIFIIPIGLSALVSLRTSVFLDRYFIFASLGLILLGARALSFLPRNALRSATVLVAALGVVSILQFWQALDFPRHPGARAAANFLFNRVQPEEPIVVSSSFVYFPMAFHLGCAPQYHVGYGAGIDTGSRLFRTRGADGYPTWNPPPRGGTCAGNLDLRLYAASSELAHFAGGPILTSADLVGPEVFRVAPPRLWVVDTTGFGRSEQSVPEGFVLEREERFPELFPYQGEIIVRAYRRS